MVVVVSGIDNSVGETVQRVLGAFVALIAPALIRLGGDAHDDSGKWIWVPLHQQPVRRKGGKQQVEIGQRNLGAKRSVVVLGLGGQHLGSRPGVAKPDVSVGK